MKKNKHKYFHGSDICLNCINIEQRIHCYRIVISIFIFLLNHSRCISEYYKYMIDVGLRNDDFIKNQSATSKKNKKTICTC